MIALLGLALAAPVRFERVDLLAEDSAWLQDELPRAGLAPRGAALRWAEQLRVAVAIPNASLVLGASLTDQSVAWRRPLTRRAPVLGSVGLSSRLGLPRGATAAVEAWAGPVRLAAGVQLVSSATWARPVWDGWRPTVGLGVGIGRRPLPW